MLAPLHDRRTGLPWHFLRYGRDLRLVPNFAESTIAPDTVVPNRCPATSDLVPTVVDGAALWSISRHGRFLDLRDGVNNSRLNTGLSLAGLADGTIMFRAAYPTLATKKVFADHSAEVAWSVSLAHAAYARIKGQPNSGPC